MNKIKTDFINVDREIKEYVLRQKQMLEFNKKNAKKDGLQSIFLDPLMLNTNYWGKVQTISPYYKGVSYRTLRRVSEKAWILNLCISNIIKKVRPFLKPIQENRNRGFSIKKKRTIDNNSQKMTTKEKKVARELEEFFLNTGDVEDLNRTDDLDKYVSKLLRDLCQLDQIACEIEKTKGGEVCAFWAVDPATIEIALSQSIKETGIKFVQVINHIPYAFYEEGELLFDCMNPRTDIERSGYGYSVVEQAIDLITSSINTFIYNAGFFTESKIPRGFLLLNGDADQEQVEEMEDYLVNMMSGSPSSQWRVPIVPSGKNEGGEGSRRLEWVNLQGTNKEMEFQAWFDLQLSGIVGLFGFSMEDLGLHSQKSAPLIGNDVSPKIESSKSLVLGDMLSFLQKHFNMILKYKNPEYEFEFVGYERDDPKVILDMDKEEVASYKTLNEKREEKGYKVLDFTEIKNPADLPMNPQVIQAWQGVQQGGNEEKKGDIDGEEMMQDMGMQESDEDVDNAEVEANDDGEEALLDNSEGEDSKDLENGNKKRVTWDMLSKSLKFRV